MNLLEVRNIKVQFGARQVLAGVDFDLRPGEVLGLIGPNGAGKSTLIKAVAGLLPVQEGYMEWMGRPAHGISQKEKAKLLSYFAQGALCYWPLTAERVITLGRLPHVSAWQRPKGQDDAAIARATAQTEVKDLLPRVVTTLSFGERTRVLLARALAVEAPILLADEPVANLDPSHQLHVMGLLDGLAKEGRGVVVVLHDLSLAARFCHRLILLHEGRALALGIPRDVLTPDNLRRAYGIHAHYGHQDNEFFVLPWKRHREGMS